MSKESKIRYCSHCGASKIGKLYSLEEVANLTSTSIRTWQKRIANREITYTKVGKSVRIPADVLFEFIEVIPAVIDIVNTELIETELEK